MGEFFRRIRYLINRRRLDAELESDVEFHREMAARAGRRNFGNTLRLREQAREAWGWAWLDRLVQDLHFGLRILARSPGFTLMAVLVLGIGIGVNVSAFSLFDMVALKPLPVRDPDTIVRLERRSPNSYSSEMSYPSFAFYRDHAKTLSAAMAVLGVPPMQIDDDASLGGQHPDIWLPMAQQPYFIAGSQVLTDFGDSSVRMWGRLAPGVTAKMAEQELGALTNELRRQHPGDIWDGEYLQSSTGGHLQVMQSEMYRVAAMAGALTLLILAVSCANLGGLLLAKAVTR